jgi:hypothetical protein
MANPYNKPEKRMRDDGRQPLHPKSPNEPARSKSNPFAKFARRDKDNTGATKCLDRFFVHEDVRFVKRTFPKDGTRTVLQSAPPAAKVAASVPSTTVDLTNELNAQPFDSPGIPEQRSSGTLRQSSFDYGPGDGMHETVDDHESIREPDSR